MMEMGKEEEDERTPTSKRPPSKAAPLSKGTEPGLVLAISPVRLPPSSSNNNSPTTGAAFPSPSSTYTFLSLSLHGSIDALGPPLAAAGSPLRTSGSFGSCPRTKSPKYSAKSSCYLCLRRRSCRCCCSSPLLKPPKKERRRSS